MTTRRRNPEQLKLSLVDFIDVLIQPCSELHTMLDIIFWQLQRWCICCTPQFPVQVVAIKLSVTSRTNTELFCTHIHKIYNSNS